ncbi:MAG: hypothetical protein PHG16_12850 [Lachnospiraceae bacterium]|nr:hypothetical protein [Lachnospiraceae bacterium]
MLVYEVLETIMLICFGLSWPINAYKHYKAGTAKSMSLPFMILIISGYIAGIVGKYLNPNYHFNYVLVVYYLNLVMVSVDVVVYFINKKKDAARLEK